MVFVATSPIETYLTECYELVDDLEGDLLAAQQGQSDDPLIQRLFRALHTIKGSSSLFGFRAMEGLAHVAETLLSRVRDGELTLTEERVSALLASVDVFRTGLERIEAHGNDEGTPADDARAAIAAVVGDGAQSEAPSIAPAPTGLPDDTVFLFDDEEAEAETEVEAAAAEAASPSPAPAPEGGPRTRTRASTIRVRIETLDKMMELLGELVLSKNRILRKQVGRVDNSYQQLDHVVSELQDVIMEARLQPFEQILNQLQRAVLDAAQQTGKKVELLVEGRETEVDKTVLESIADPLMHIVRNAVDHGIEAPDDRKKAGKSEAGTIRLRATHESGNVRIEVRDDGRGLVLEQILQRAIERGLVRREQAGQMSPTEIQELLFTPGFSCAESVTRLSGRGVGMDVVKTQVEAIGGVVKIESDAGMGTVVRLEIPLTLAVLPALCVGSGGWSLAVPQASVQELLKLNQVRILDLEGVRVMELRGALYPLYYLGEVFHTPEPRVGDQVVLLRVDQHLFGLVVDQVEDSEDVVVKPLGAFFAHSDCYAAASILGDGTVAPILDVPGFARHIGMEHALAQVRKSEAKRDAEAKAAAAELDGVVMAEVAGSSVAVEMTTVHRLESFSEERLESFGGYRAVQYEGRLMNLLELAQLMPSADGASATKDTSGGSVDVIVCEVDGRTVGLVVDQLHDIVAHEGGVVGEGSRFGVAGTMVIGGRGVEMLDVKSLVAHYDAQRARGREVHA